MPHVADLVMTRIGRLQAVRDEFVHDRERIKKLYPSVDPQRDARISAYTKAINALNSVQLAMTFAAKHLLHDEWWAAITPQHVSDSDKKIYVEEYANFIGIGFSQSMFLVVESSLRLFLRGLDPGACNRGTAEFKSVYECLFRNKLSTVPYEGIELLELFRLVRNTVHNNGVYFHKTQSDARVTWDGETFEFKHGQPVSFANIEFLIRISGALRRLLREVIEDPSLRAVTAQINDLQL